MSCARGGAGGAGAAVGVMGKGVASRAVLGMSSLHIVSATPALLTDDRIRAAYSEGAGIYRILPRAVAVPGSVAELAALVRWAADTRAPLVPRGAGSGMAGGNVGRGVIVDLSQGFRALTVDPARRLARAGASVTWAEINAAARGLGLRLPPDPSSGAFATSGGMVSTNAAGPRSPRYGRVRGRLDPISPAAAGVALGFGELEALTDTAPSLLALNPSAGELLDRTILSFVEAAGVPPPAGLACLLLVEFERETAMAARGVVGDAVRGLKHLTAHVETAVDRPGLERLWRVRTLASPALARLSESRRSLQVIEDGCVPIEGLGEYIACVRAAADRLELQVVLFGHAGDGHVHVNTLPDVSRPGWEDGVRALYEAVTALQVRLGGTPSGEDGGGRLGAGLLERVYGPEVVAQFRRVKEVYDPLEILNPGVILPAADWQPLVDLKVGAAATPIPDDIAARLRKLERTASWATPKTSLAGT